MIPEGNNVYGIITAPHGLQPVLQAVERLVAGGEAYIYLSQFNFGAETLHLSSESVELNSEPLEDGVHHLFNGGVGGSPEEVVHFIRALSESLSRSGIGHSFEIYDDQQLVQQVPG